MDLLDIVLDYECNFKCSYCTITAEMRPKRLEARDVARRIAEAAGDGTVAISVTGGEPTLRPELLGLCRFARDRGFTEIKVQTNGLVFAEPANVERMLAAGVTRVHVSVHGYDPRGPERYERITRTEPGTQATLLRAIDNLVASGVHLEADVIVMNDTWENLPETVADLHRRGILRVNLWYVSLTDGNADNVESLPRISDVIGKMTACMDYGREHGVTVLSFHVPRCLLRGYEDHVWHPGAGMDVRVVTPDADFQLSKSRLAGGFKPQRCGRCIWFARCPGLRPDYVGVYGDSEIEPVVG